MLKVILVLTVLYGESGVAIEQVELKNQALCATARDAWLKAAAQMSPFGTVTRHTAVCMTTYSDTTRVER
jgi:hypothetical protein